MTATERCSMLRFTFPLPASVLPAFWLKLRVQEFQAWHPWILTDAEITGYNPHRMDAHLGPLALPHFKGYFVIQFQKAPTT